MSAVLQVWLRSGLGELKARLAERSFRWYLVKAALGVSLCYVLHALTPGEESLWSIVSVVLVLAPDDKDAIRLAFERMKANSLGALVGWLTALSPLVPWLELALAVPLAILVCLFFRLGTATRSALAGLVIVMVPASGALARILALERVLYVFAGCLIGLLITVGSRGAVRIAAWLAGRSKHERL